MNKKILIAVSIAAFFFLSMASNANTNRPNQKRQASSGKRNIRSATGGSAPATSRSTARSVSSQGRNSSRQQTNRKRNINGRAGSSGDGSGSICPIETIVKRVIDEQGLEIFYKEKNTICKSPSEQITNVVGNNNGEGFKRPSWVAGKDIYVFRCVQGTTLFKNNNAEECLNVINICPLNEVIKKVSANEYISLTTNAKCKLPMNSSLENLTGAKNTRSDVLTDDEAYKLNCNANYYSAMEANLTVKCIPCLTGTYSPSGSTSTADCKAPVK